MMLKSSAVQKLSFYWIDRCSLGGAVYSDVASAPDDNDPALRKYLW